MKKLITTTLLSVLMCLTHTAHAEEIVFHGIGRGLENSCAEFVVAARDIPPGPTRQFKSGLYAGYLSSNDAYINGLRALSLLLTRSSR
jgi:hypothetical protein